MEQVYRPEKFSCTQHINLKEHFSKFSSICFLPDTLKPDTSSASYPECIKNKFKLKEVDLNDPQMELNTSVHILSEDPPETKYSPFSTLSDANSIVKEKVLQTTKIRNAKRKSMPVLTKSFPKTDLFATNVVYKQNNDSDAVHPDEFAINIRIYHPFEFYYNSDKPNSYQNVKFSHEIVALGRNTLADLRDKILCFNDAGIFMEVQNPFVQLPHKLDAKKEYPSGSIFIDNVFYNDFRDPGSIDYSEVIIQWAKKKRIQPLKVDSMATTRLEQLTPRFGYPYVYLHQGKCEHIIVFTDAWLIMNQDLNLSDYPRYQGVHRFHTRLCILCNATSAQWMIINSDRLPHARAFLCIECMHSYLYKDDQKIGDFKVYQFCDKNRII